MTDLVNLADVHSILLADGWHSIDGLRFVEADLGPDGFICLEQIGTNDIAVLSGPVPSILALRS